MSLNYDTIKHMNLFTPDALANEYIEQYAYEHGQKKAIKIIRKVEDSVKVKHYLNSIVHDTLKPSAKGLETLMNTINYFMFSKEETLCLGGLATFVLWRDRFMSKERVSDVLEQEKIDHLLTPICSELIYNCSVNKINQSDNFFLRFQKRIIRIVREEEINDIWNSNKEIKSGSVSVTKTKDKDNVPSSTSFSFASSQINESRDLLKQTIEYKKSIVPGNLPKSINKKIDLLKDYFVNLESSDNVSVRDIKIFKSKLDELITDVYEKKINGENTRT